MLRRMLTTPRAVLLAAVLVGLAILAHGLLPRYDVRAVNADGTFVRVDRWTGHAEVGFIANGHASTWLTVSQPNAVAVR